MSRMACSSNAIVESNGDVHGDFGIEYLDMIDFTGVEVMHSGDNGTEMNGLQMHSALPILAHLETFSQVGGITFELSIQHNLRQMGEQNMRNLVKRKLKDSRTIYTPSDIIRDVKQNFGVTINYCKAWRSRELALMSIRGSVEEAYSLLPAYCHELERVNSGTRTYIHTDENNHFLYFFMAVGACIRGFQSSMRPVIAVDATHLKCKYKGVLFVANAFDGNRNIYPLAFRIGDLETDASWHWFFSKLHEVIVAKSYGIAEFDRHFRKIKGNDEVAQYLESARLHKWSRAHMDGRRYNVMTTNIAESINPVLRFARMLPMVHLIDEIINLLVKWFSKRHDFALKCSSTLCPDFGEKKLRRSCKKFQLEQLPCKHVVAVCRFLKLNVYSMASRYYTRNTWLDAYSFTIYLVQPQELWVIPEDV
ncbi:uncharacterized protein LOC117612938 [Prunus dulcis]|uniref:uncharacterized protein LOC117612938 n=1 Tax=Prunus dulcis TaxID=3755 RepID=UPI001483582C|nr:uncharacterized protein LOC117612938 [Prunus dulcis]